MVAQLSERLVSVGHDVTVATSATSKNPLRSETIHNGVKIESFGIGGGEVRGYTGSESERLRFQNLLMAGGFDIVVLFAAQQWSVDLALPILSKIPAKKVFVPTGFSRLKDPRYEEYFKALPTKMNEMDLNVFLSNTYQDIVFAQKNNVNNIRVIPNGADEREFLHMSENKKMHSSLRQKLHIPEDSFLILLVGSHTGKKGHREAAKIFSQAKIKNSTLLIVGNSYGRGCTYGCAWRNFAYNVLPAGKKAGKRLLTISLSREDTVSAYETANLFLFPSNIECSPIVLFEAAASGTPFLASDAGNSAEIAEWTGAGKILPTLTQNSGYLTVDIAESALMLEKMYSEPALRNQLAKNGRTAWQERFTWAKIASEYEKEYKKLLQQK